MILTDARLALLSIFPKPDLSRLLVCPACSSPNGKLTWGVFPDPDVPPGLPGYSPDPAFLAFYRQLGWNLE